MKLLKGKILKVKTGYNPNSSSIGVYVDIFVWGTAAAALVINLIGALIDSRKKAK
ncbi:MAG: hypothetical protein ABIA63_14095 [bacterium]